MHSTPQVDRLRRAAKRLYRELYSTDARVLDAASRFQRLRTYQDSTPDEVLRRRSEIQLKHALAVVAEEHGHASWRALLAHAHDPLRRWTSAAYFAIRHRLGKLQIGDSGFDDALIAAARETGIGSSVEAQAYTDHFRRMELWIRRNEALLRTAGLIQASERTMVPHQALADVLCDAVLVHPTGAGQADDSSFDLHRIAGDAMLRRLGWSGRLPGRQTESTGAACTADLLPLPADTPVSAETWCYATPGDGTAHRMPWEVAAPLLCGWRPDIDPTWRAPDGSIRFMGIVVLRVRGAVRFIERAAAAVTQFPVLVLDANGRHSPSAPERDCRAVVDAMLAEAGAPADESAVLTHLFTGLRAVTHPCRLEAWFAHIVTEQEHRGLVEAALAPSRRRIVWDLVGRRPVVPGFPLRALPPE